MRTQIPPLLLSLQNFQDFNRYETWNQATVPNLLQGNRQPPNISLHKSYILRNIVKIRIYIKDLGADAVQFLMKLDLNVLCSNTYNKPVIQCCVPQQ